LEEEMLVSVEYLIGEANILSGRKAFGVKMVNYFFFAFISILTQWSDHLSDNSDKLLRHPIVGA
jgi:hypothetical protein